MANRALNIVLSKGLSQDSLSLKANKFFIAGGHVHLSESLCAIRGYFYSIRPAMGHILLNLNACTSAFFQPTLVSKFLSDAFTFKSLEEREPVLRGLRVCLIYTPKHIASGEKSAATSIEARNKTIEGTGEVCSRLIITIKSKTGGPNERMTLQQYFQKSKLSNQMTIQNYRPTFLL